MINLGKAAKHLRSRLGLSQRQAAAELGISHIHLSNIENDKVSPTASMIEKFYNTWGVDLYMLAVVKFSEGERLPEGMQASIEDLVSFWDSDIERRIALHREDDASCSGSKG